MKIYAVEYKDQASGQDGFQLFSDREQARIKALRYFAEFPVGNLNDRLRGDYFVVGEEFGDHSDYGGVGCIFVAHCVSKKSILKVGRYRRDPIPKPDPRSPILTLTEEQIDSVFELPRTVKVKVSGLVATYDATSSFGQVAIYERDVPDEMTRFYLAEVDGEFSDLYSTRESARDAIVYGPFGDYSAYGGKGCIWHRQEVGDTGCVYEIFLDGDIVSDLDYPRPFSRPEIL